MALGPVALREDNGPCQDRRIPDRGAVSQEDLLHERRELVDRNEPHRGQEAR